MDVGCVIGRRPREQKWHGSLYSFGGLRGPSYFYWWPTRAREFLLEAYLMSCFLILPERSSSKQEIHRVFIGSWACTNDRNISLGDFYPIRTRRLVNCWLGCTCGVTQGGNGILRRHYLQCRHRCRARVQVRPISVSGTCVPSLQYINFSPITFHPVLAVCYVCSDSRSTKQIQNPDLLWSIVFMERSSAVT